MESITDFYPRKFDWMPDNLKNDIGHFNPVFKLLHFAMKMQPSTKLDKQPIIVIVSNEKRIYALFNHE
ncbi:MAG: hypothetical protein RLZZ628_1701 [Bacteroidota bacterium]